MENDLISRSAMLKELRPVEQDDYRSAVLMSDAKEIFCSFIRKFPAVDAVEVVRCKDCAWLYDDNGTRCCDNPKGSKCINPDGSDFCSDGERRADDAID